MKLIVTLLFGLVLSSCNFSKTGNENQTSQIYHLTVVDSTGRFDGRKVTLEISDNYKSGLPKKMSYVIDDTVLVFQMLESGFISKKQTFINNQLVNETLIDVKDWENSKLYKVKSVTAENLIDTLEITVVDNSYIWFDEYVKWKSDYLIWLNREKLSLTKNIKTKFIQDGKNMTHEFLYLRKDIDAILNTYSYNSKLDSISSVILSVFEPADLMNIRNANHYLNETLKEYDGNFVQLMYDFSTCENNCFAEKRLRFIGNMLHEVKLDDFWSDGKIEPNGFIERLNIIFEIMNREKI